MMTAPDKERIAHMADRAGALVETLRQEGHTIYETTGIVACIWEMAMMELSAEERISAAFMILQAMRRVGVDVDQHGRVVAGARA